MHLLTLPYDIRHQIYQQAFPSGEQIHIQVQHDILRAITPSRDIPIELLRTCRLLHAETSDFLYNSYLFNLVGTKRDCLRSYKQFLETFKRYARDDVHVDALSNGSHSATMCFSIHAGEGKRAILKRRNRGELKDIQELKDEVAMASVNPETSSRRRLRTLLASTGFYAIASAIVAALLSIILAWLTMMRSLW